MLRTTILALALALPGVALACGGKSQTASADEAPRIELAAVDADATSCAKKAELVGSSCKYSTGMMAQRVHADGASTKLTASLEHNKAALDSNVAAPFKVNGDLYVIANEVIDGIDDPKAQLALEGKVLEVDGIKYFLVTGFQKATS